MRKFIIGSVTTALILCSSITAAVSKEKVKIALIDGLSGQFALTGQSALRELKLAVKTFIKNDDLDVEVIALDGKNSPGKAIAMLNQAIEQGARYIVQGSSSSVANALVATIARHNKKNPDKRVLFLNHSAVDPILTNKRCNFWHFRFDGHVGMKMNALTDAIAKDKKIKTVYLIGQNYSFGKTVAVGAQKLLKLKRPDIKIVGNELHPFGRVKDFSPYAKNIKASNADAVITGNWGADMVLLAKALGAEQVNTKVYTFYAAGSGVTSTIGASGEGRILVVTEGRPNPMTEEQFAYWEKFKAAYPENDLLFERIPLIARMLDKAFKESGSTDPYKVAKVLEGMEIMRMDGSKAVMRAKDHQIQIDLSISAHTKLLPKYKGGKIKDFDGAGFGLVVSSVVPREKNSLSTSCKMVRPEK